MKKTIILALITALLLVSCRQSVKKQETPGPKTFKMVSVPALLTDPAQRADYLAIHYWDNFDFTDTSYISFPEVTEQALSNYLAILNYAAPQTPVKSIASMLHKAEADSLMFAYFVDLYDRYLYDPNSPLRNEEFYIPVLELSLASDIYDPTMKLRQQYSLDMVLKNRVGESAADFHYVTASGATGTLYAIKGEYTMIFFNNPDCSVCAQIIEAVRNSPVMAKFISEGRLKVLALYPDEDLTAWRENLSKLPSEWINGHAAKKVLFDGELYDLKAIPSLYLLDKDKTVILKDAPLEQIEEYLVAAQR